MNNLDYSTRRRRARAYLDLHCDDWDAILQMDDETTIFVATVNNETLKCGTLVQLAEAVSEKLKDGKFPKLP